MGTVNINLGDATKLNLILGRQNENEVTEVVFDFSAWNTEFGSGTVGLSVQRPGDKQPYAVVPTVSGTDATWEISSLDTAYKGTGEIQLTYTVGTVKKKSVIYKFTVYESLGANGEYPSPGQNWQEEIEDELADVKQDLEKTNNSITADDLIFTVGAIGIGGQQYLQPNQNRINSAKTPIYVLGGTISCDADYKFRVGYYSTPEIPYDVVHVSNFVKWSNWITNDSYTVESGYYIVILAGKSDDSTINHAKDVSSHLSISITVASKDVAYKNATEITSNTKLWSQGLYSASTGNYEASNYRIKQDGYIPKYIDVVYTDTPYMFRICAWGLHFTE